MTNSKVKQTGRRAEKLWLPSLLLLLGQFLTITPALLIVFAGEQQRRTSDGYATLLDGLDRLSFTVPQLEITPPPGVSQEGWQQQYSDCRGELNRTLSSSTPAPQIRETLVRVDSIVNRMAKTESDLAVNKRPEQAAPLAAAFRKDARTARSQLLDAQRAVRLELSTTGNSISQMTTYLKTLVGGACLLAFGVVFLVRKFRLDADIQKELQQELQTINQEVIAALSAARSESEAKNQFLAHVGHLMRTPLNAIVGGAGELLQTDLTSRQRDCAQTSRELAESLAKVAGQVTDYSRMESGRLELQIVEFDPSRVVADVLQLFSLAAERKGLRLKNAITEDLPRAVKGDPERLHQVLVNLMSNAVRFTQQGEISLRVEEVIGVEGRTSLRFEVKDTGIGIAEQVRERIFQPFSILQPINQAGASATGANQGTGLGLAISKKLVELMGGKINVASQPGRGCTFCFTAVFESVRARTQPHPESSELPSSATDTLAADAAVSPTPQNGKKARERRTEPRHGINYPTLLRSEHAGIAIIRVLDVSASGLRVSVPFRLGLHSEVEIRIEGASVNGIVRNCTCIAANEFHVGIEIPPSSSSDEQFLHHLRLLRVERVRN
jgi:signal transduction histidine kinase